MSRIHNPFHTRLRTTIFIIFAILIAALLTPLSLNLNSSWTLAKFQSQTLDWKSCLDDTVQCASFKVPVDYNTITNKKSTKDVFTLQVLRHKATDPKHRIGSLIVNPGGPGASAMEYAFNYDSIVSEAINKRYDIVGFDPRGVNKSDPIRCLNNKDEDRLLSANGRVTNAQEERQYIANAKYFADKCAQAAGDRLGHYSTLETAKDMEVLRILLGDSKLHYLGKSYGTYLGTLYAALYPTNVGHMVLDGAIDPNQSVRDQNLSQAIGFDNALKDFLKSKVNAPEKESNSTPSSTTSSSTSYSSTRKLTLAAIKDFVTASHIKPLTSKKGRTLTDELLITAIATALYDNETGWPQINSALRQAIDDKNPSELLSLADDYTQRDLNGKYITNMNDISAMTSCLDGRDTRTFAQVRGDESFFESQAPIFGPFLNYAGINCSVWKAPAQTPPKITQIMIPPVIIIGVTNDPATPYSGATALHKIMTYSTLLTFQGDGHTGLYRGKIYIDQFVSNYFAL